MRTITVNVDVDVELDDIDDDDLIDELERRNLGVPGGNPDFFVVARDLLRLGKTSNAVELLRIECQDRFGCVI